MVLVRTSATVNYYIYNEFQATSITKPSISAQGSGSSSTKYHTKLLVIKLLNFRACEPISSIYLKPGLH